MNPELQRNLILELTPRRLTWALVAVGLTCVAALMAVSLGDGAFGRRVSALNALGFVGGWMFLGACLIWGARQAGSAIITEVGERTWDFQRMSALSPWSMTWGKLFGATSLAWVIGLIGLFLALLNGLTGAAPGRVLQLAAAALAAAVLLQAASMASALVAVRKARVEGRLATLRNRRSAIAGIVFLIFAVNGAIRGWMAVRQGRGGGASGLDAGAVWWGVSFSWEGLLLLSAVLFAAWAVVGAWRLMRLELQSENSVWLWAGFALCCGLYVAGFADLRPLAGDLDGAPSLILTRAVAAGGVFALLCYLAAFAEPADRQRMGAFRRAVSERRLDRAALTAPLVAAPLLLAALAWTVVALAAPAHVDGAGGVGRDLSPVTVGLAVLLYLIRDLGVIAYVRFSPRPKRSDASAVLALVLLYLVGGVIAPALGGGVGLAIVSPFGRPTTLAIIAGGAEAVLAWWLAAARIFGQPATSKEASAPLPAA